MNDDMVARGKAIIAGGKYAPTRGEFLGRIEQWGLDVYEGSPPQWKDLLIAEIRGEPC
jgi:hypothetical protein